MGKSSRRHRRHRSTVGWPWIAGVVALAIVSVGLAVAALARDDVTTADQATAGPIPTFGATPAPTESTEPVELPFVQIPLPTDPNVLFVGDSYTKGFGASNPATLGWAPLTATALGWDFRNYGVGSTGFTRGGQADDATDTFIARVDALASEEPNYRPDLVVVQGGQNDWRASAEDEAQAVTDTLTAIRSHWPGVPLVVIGVAAADPLGESLAPTNAAVVQAAAAFGASTLDVVSADWFTAENSAAMMAPDGQHLSDAGHQFLSENIVAWLTDRIAAA